MWLTTDKIKNGLKIRLVKDYGVFPKGSVGTITTYERVPSITTVHVDISVEFKGLMPTTFCYEDDYRLFEIASMNPYTNV